MKSLEIVNKLIKHDKDQLEFYLSNGVPKEKLKKMYKDIEEFKTIKQDLEVLEIIRKKKVDFVHLNNYLFLYDKNEEVLEKYNKYCFYQNELTMEELLKLKQWLEDQQ